MYMLIQNFFSFPEYQIQKFLAKFEFQFINPTVLRGGAGYEYEFIEQLGGELKYAKHDF